LLHPPCKQESAQFTNVSGFVIFRYNTNVQDAVVPLESRGENTYVIPFRQTSGTATGIAISAVSSGAVNVPVTLRSDTGAMLAPGTGSITLAANAHTSFVLSAFFPQTVGHSRNRRVRCTGRRSN